MEYSASLRQIFENHRRGFEELEITAPLMSLAGDIAVHHGRSLRRLKLHAPEPSRDERMVLSKGDMEHLAMTCILLEDLYLDVNSIEDRIGSFGLSVGVAMPLTSL